MIEVERLTFAYSHKPPLFDGFSWSIERGQAWAVIGASGCGKTTLLYLLAGLLNPAHGRVSIAGEELTRPRPNTGLILQDYGLLPWATLRDNIALGLRVRRFYGPDGLHAPRGQAVGDSVARVSSWLSRLGLEGVADQYPLHVSGGQRQRAAVARTLVLAPDLLLMDEPFSSLDAPTRESLQALTLDLHAEHELTTVIVTHSIEEAAFMGQRILFLGVPPQREAVVLENPSALRGNRDRGDAGYRAVCAQLRSLLDVAVSAGERAAA